MYLDHFGLSEAPFQVTPDTRVFFPGAERGKTLDAVLYAVIHDGGIVKVIGDIGTGKTMLCRMLIDRLPAHALVVYLPNPSLSPDDLLHAIADELGITVPALGTGATLRLLHERLGELHGQGRRVVVLIDEAQAMPVETLEEIRLLSNLEAGRYKLLQLVLFGQPELNHVLMRPEMRQLRERITHHFALRPLARDEVTAYLKFRLRATGHRGGEIFASAALKRLAAASLGLTRRINVLADKTLRAAFTEGAQQVSSRHVRAAIRDFDLSPDRRRRLRLWAALAILALAGIAWSAYLTEPDWHPAKLPPVPPPLQYPIAPPAPEPAAPATPATKAPTAKAASTEAPASEAAAAKAKTAKASPTKAASAKTPVADAPHPAPVPNPYKLGPVTLARFQATQQWLLRATDDDWFLQLLTADASNAPQIEDFVATVVREADAGQVHIYITKVDGKSRIGVIYGDYPSSQAAAAAAKKLPASLRKLNPFPRRVKWVR